MMAETPAMLILCSGLLDGGAGPATVSQTGGPQQFEGPTPDFYGT